MNVIFFLNFTLYFSFQERPAALKGRSGDAPTDLSQALKLACFHFSHGHLEKYILVTLTSELGINEIHSYNT